MERSAIQNLDRRWVLRSLFAFSGALGMSKAIAASPIIIEDFRDGKASGWRYVSDRVMGGISNGEFQIVREGKLNFARLSGTVSTANNGGFIQMRRDLEQPFAKDTSGLMLRVRGNGEKYFIHLRPKSARRPWHYFAAPIDTSGEWQEVTLPWSRFSAQGGLQASFSPDEATGIGIVAYGADYEAKLDVAWISLV
ncbi:MAG: CIA30 family protein [Pseudomonadota bacterium]